MTLNDILELTRKGPSEHDVALSQRLVENTPAFIGGSYLTNPDTANDIDVIIGETQYWEYESHFIGFETMETEGEYSGIHELAWTARHRNVNVLVVKDMFLPAYAQAADYMERSPYMYQTRKERIKLHQKLKNLIRQQHDIELIAIEE